MPYSPMELAEAFLKTGEIQDALDALNQQLAEQPADENARRLRIQVLMHMKTPEDLNLTIADFKALSAPNAEDYQRQSILQERLGNLEAAIIAIRKARELAPQEERLTERLLDLLLANKDFEAALNLVREQERSWRWLEREGDILALLGEDTLATARYGLVLAHLEEFEGKMRSDYLQALKARVMLARAHAYRRLGQIEPAEEFYHLAQVILPKDPSINFNLGLLAEMRGDTANAVSLCQKALKSATPILQAEMQSSLLVDEQFSNLRETLLKST